MGFVKICMSEGQIIYNSPIVKSFCNSHDVNNYKGSHSTKRQSNFDMVVN